MPLTFIPKSTLGLIQGRPRTFLDPLQFLECKIKNNAVIPSIVQAVQCLYKCLNPSMDW